MPKSLVARIRLIYFPLDLTFGILIPLALVNGVGAKDATYALFVLYALGIGRTLIIMFGFGRVLAPIGRWLELAPTRPEPRELRMIDAMIRNGPVRLTFWVGIAWALQLSIAAIVLLYVDPYRAEIAPRSAVTVGLMAGAVVLGSVPFVVPLMSILLNPSGRKAFAITNAARIPLQRESASLKFKLVYLMTAIGLAGPVWMASTSYSVDGTRAALEARLQSMTAASDLARQL